MSLLTDRFFYHALLGNQAINRALEGRIFNPARPTIDEKEDRIPYVVITLMGGQNDTATKDYVEGDTDTVDVAVLVVASDRDSLAPLTKAIRRQFRNYLDVVENDESHPDHYIAPKDWEFSFDAVQYDDMKPCVYQGLLYKCGTIRD